MEENVKGGKNKMRKFLISLFCILLLTGCAFVKNDNVEDGDVLFYMDKKSVDDLISKGAILIDVRTKEEYDEYHIEGAINFPYDEIDNSFPYSTDHTLILYCRSGARASVAEQTLRDLGYSFIYNLGSIENYK